MRAVKKLKEKYLAHFFYFYSNLRYRLFVTLGLSIFTGVLDGFGLAMFLPLLEMVDGAKVATADGLGRLRFLVDAMNYVGLGLTMNAVLFVIILLFTLKGLATFAEQYYKVRVMQYFIKKLRFDSVTKLSNFKYKAFVTADSGRIQNTLSGEVGRVVQAYRSYFMAVQSGILVALYVVLAYLSNPQFAIFVTIGSLLSNLLYKQIYKRTVAASKKITTDGHHFQGLLIQKVSFFKYLKATGLILKFTEKLKESIVKIEESNRKIGFYNSVLSASREPLVIWVVTGVIFIQVVYFSESLGLIILSLLFFYRALIFLTSLQTQWNLFLNASGALENMTSFIKELSGEQEQGGMALLDSRFELLELNRLSFSYGDKSILKDINLCIRKNDSVAFVGESGSGKTTLINILTGLILPDQGEMLVNGINSSKLDIKSYQSKIGYITQEPVIFTDNIYNNVTLWSEDNARNKERFWEALRKASIEDYVKDLTDGEYTELGSNGILISGGQKQRLSIARELYKDIDLLILDEATSALDSESEQVIQQNIDSLRGCLTIIIVAHRLSTIKNVDKICLLDSGYLSAVGSFEGMLQSSVKFKRMVSLQEF